MNPPAERWTRLARSLPDPTPPPGARERIWRELNRAGDAPPRSSFWIPAGVGAACAVLAFAVIANLWRAPVAHLGAAVGEVQVSRSGAWISAAPGDELASGSALRTRGAGRAYLRFDDAGALLGASTTATVSRGGATGKGLQVSLAQGTVVVADDPRPVEREFSVRAGAYTVSVLGTVFSVAQEEGRVEVRVQEGRVQVTGPRTQVLLTAGQSWSSEEGLARAQVPAKEAALAARWVHQEGSFRADDFAAAPPPPSPAQEAAAPPAPVPADAAAPAPAPALAVRATRRSVPRPVAVAGGAFDDVTMLRARVMGAATAEERGQLEYELGKALTARGEYSPAAAAYRASVKASPVRAELSMYEIGRLELRYLGDPAAAAVAFRETRARFPEGQLAPEVALSLIEALLDQHDEGEALREMDAYLEKFPGNERVGEVRSLREELKRHFY